MIKSGYHSPCLDRTAGLTEDQRRAAQSAGHGVPVLTEEAKYLMSQQASNTVPAQPPRTNQP